MPVSRRRGAAPALVAYNGVTQPSEPSAHLPVLKACVAGMGNCMTVLVRLLGVTNSACPTSVRARSAPQIAATESVAGPVGHLAVAVLKEEAAPMPGIV